MENEHFYGWGPEDYERYERWVNLNLKVYNAPGCMYHLSHPRDVNGKFSSQLQSELTNAERTKSKNSSYGELREIYSKKYRATKTYSPDPNSPETSCP
jgi:hypothetical protein